MANHKSAWKRIRQTEKRNAQNRTVRSAMRSQVKKAQGEIATGGATGTTGEVKAAVQALARAGQTGILHKRTAARRISRLMKAANRSAQSK